MLKAYRRGKIRTKVIVFVLLLAMIAAYCVNFAQAALVPSFFGTALVALALHFMITFPRFFVIILASTIQIVFIGFSSLLYTAYGALAKQTGIGTDTALAIITSIIILALSTGIILFIATNYGRGRLIVTFIVSFIILDFSGLIFAFSLNGTPYILTLLAPAVLSIVFTILRSLRIFKRKISEDSALVRKQIFSFRSDKKISKLVENNKWKAFKVEGKTSFWVINIKTKIFILAGIELQEKLRKSKNGYMYRTVPIENIFSEIIEEANKISFDYKIPKNKTHLVIFDTNANYPLPAKAYQEYELAPKFNKNNVKSKFIVASASGVREFSSKMNDVVSDNLWNKIVKE